MKSILKLFIHSLNSLFREFFGGFSINIAHPYAYYNAMTPTHVMLK